MMKLIVVRWFVVCVFLTLPFFSSYGENNLDERAVTYRQEGYRRQSMGDIQNAFNYYYKAIQIEPLYAQVYNDLGVLFEAVGDEVNVVKMYTKAIDIDPQYLPAYTNLAFFHEKKGDMEKANYYWQKRYELGKEGEYWWEVAKQHLDQLEIYPPFVKQRQDKAAKQLQEQLTYKREQTRLKIVEEARLRFKAGSSLFLKGDYTAAIKEFQIAKFLNPPDEELKAKTDEFIKKSEEMLEKRRALNYTEEALDYLESDDFLSAGEKLKDAFSVISDISQKK